jgi:hypothetical protein
MRNDDAINRSVGRNRNIINDPVDRVPQKFKAGDKRNIEFFRGESVAEGRRIIKVQFGLPAVDEWTRIEIFYATNAEGFQREK